MLITDNGIVIRVKSTDISKVGRDTQGVIIMRMDKTKVSTVTVVPHEDEEEIVEGEENGEETQESIQTTEE